MSYKIIVDSSSDLKNGYLDGSGIDFEVVPLTIHINGEEFVDDDAIDVNKMLEKMHSYKGKSTSSCPSTGSFADACTADVNFIITITDKLSGSYNSAIVAKNMVEEDSSKQVYVFNSKLVNGAMILMVDHLKELIISGKKPEEIVKDMEEYISDRKLFFVLQSFENFIKNGRVSRIVGLLANVLAIKPICTGVDGEIKIATKVRGTKSCYNKLAELVVNSATDLENRTLIISHCNGQEDANKIKEIIESFVHFKKIVITEMKGLCSFYALEKGVILSY